MSRRLHIGLDEATGKARIRQSRPGKDAKTGHIGEMIFDADAIPVLRIGAGTMQMGYYLSYPQVAAGFANAAPHGCGRRPDLVIGRARALNHNGSAASWCHTIYQRTNSPQNPFIISGQRILPVAGQTGGWVLPYAYRESGQGALPSDSTECHGGWNFTWDETNIHTNMKSALSYFNESGYFEMRWAAYRFA